MVLIRKSLKILPMEYIKLDKEIEFSDKNQDKVCKDEAKFIFEQAEKLLKNTIESGNSVLTRTAILLSVTVAIFTSVLGFVINRLLPIKKIDCYIYLGFFSLLFLAYIIYNLYLNIRGYDYKDLGSEPKYLLHDYFFDFNEIEDKRLAHQYLSEIDRYQFRIRKNNEINNKRWSKFNWSLVCVLIFSGFILAAITVAIFINP